MHNVECTSDRNKAKSDERPNLKPKQRRATKLQRQQWLSSLDPPHMQHESEAETNHIIEELQRSGPVGYAADNDVPGDTERSRNPTQTTHIIGPVMARDAQVLEKYMSPNYASAVSHVRPNPYSVYSDDPINPVVYMKVPRQRGLLPLGNGTPGFKQCENMQKILEPLDPDVFSL